MRARAASCSGGFLAGGCGGALMLVSAVRRSHGGRALSSVSCVMWLWLLLWFASFTLLVVAVL